MTEAGKGMGENSKFEWFEDNVNILKDGDKIYYMTYDELTGQKAGLLEINTKTGEKKLHKQWCEIIMN